MIEQPLENRAGSADRDLLGDDGFDQGKEPVVSIPDLADADLLDHAAQDSIDVLEVSAGGLQLAVGHGGLAAFE